MFKIIDFLEPVIPESTTPGEFFTRELVHLEALLNSVVAPVALLDTSFRFIKVNDAFVKADNRYKHPSDFVGHSHFSPRFYADKENQQIFEEVLSSGQPRTMKRKKFEHPGDPRRTTYWDWTLTPIKDTDGKVLYVSLSLVDQTADQRQKDILEAQIAINNIALRRDPWAKKFEEILKVITHVPWLALERKGSIFLKNQQSGMLDMVTYQNLPQNILKNCKHIAPGYCECGKAFEKKGVTFQPHLGEFHDFQPEGMTPHGHVFGAGNHTVLNLYTPDGQEEDPLIKSFVQMAVMSHFLIPEHLELKYPGKRPPKIGGLLLRKAIERL